MHYFAKTNMADPRLGFISVGECLSADQETALGADKINELIARGALGRDDAPIEATSPVAPIEAAATEEPDEGELIEPDMMDDIVRDGAPEKKRKGHKKA